MRTLAGRAAIAALAFTVTFAAAQTAAPAAGASAAAASDDRIMAGSSLRIVERTSGDLMAAGGRLEITAPVDGDALLSGGEVRVNAAVARSVYAAGGRLQIDGELGRHLRAAGGQIELGPNARVAGNVTLAGGDLSLRGPVKGSVRMAGGRVFIDAAIDGDAQVTARQIELGPNARIGGALRWRSPGELQRHAAAQVAGPVERLALPMTRTSEQQQERADRQRARRWAAGLWWTLGLMLVAALALAAAPAVSERVVQSVRERTGMSLLAGFVTLVCVPAAVLILFITLIGAPLGLLALLLYFVLLPLGYVATAIALGQWGLGRWKADHAARIGWRIGAALLALVLLALLGRLPFIGGWIAFAALLVGLGAIVLQLLPRRAVPA